MSLTIARRGFILSGTWYINKKNMTSQILGYFVRTRISANHCPNDKTLSSEILIRVTTTGTSQWHASEQLYILPAELTQFPTFAWLPVPEPQVAKLLEYE